MRLLITFWFSASMFSQLQWFLWSGYTHKYSVAQPTWGAGLFIWTEWLFWHSCLGMQKESSQSLVLSCSQCLNYEECWCSCGNHNADPAHCSKAHWPWHRHTLPPGLWPDLWPQVACVTVQKSRLRVPSQCGQYFVCVRHNWRNNFWAGQFVDERLAWVWNGESQEEQCRAGTFLFLRLRLCSNREFLLQSRLYVHHLQTLCSETSMHRVFRFCTVPSPPCSLPVGDWFD